MKVLGVLFGLLITGCATDSGSTLSGSHAKNGRPLRYEIRRAMSSHDNSNVPQCGSKQVNVCTDRPHRKVCRCLSVYEAEVRMRQMLGQRGGPGLFQHRPR
jgi:hypothetical protein